METITIDVGVYTVLEIDLTAYDFTGIKELILTVKNSNLPGSPVLFERKFDAPAKYQVSVTPEESKLLTYGAIYDFDVVLNNENSTRLKEGDNGRIVLRRGCGECPM